MRVCLLVCRTRQWFLWTTIACAKSRVRVQFEASIVTIFQRQLSSIRQPLRSITPSLPIAAVYLEIPGQAADDCFRGRPQSTLMRLRFPQPFFFCFRCSTPSTDVQRFGDHPQSFLARKVPFNIYQLSTFVFHRCYPFGISRSRDSASSYAHNLFVLEICSRSCCKVEQEDRSGASSRGMTGCEQSRYLQGVHSEATR